MDQAYSGDHPERDDGGQTGAAGAGSGEVALHDRPRQPRHGTSVKVKIIVNAEFCYLSN